MKLRLVRAVTTSAVLVSMLAACATTGDAGGGSTGTDSATSAPAEPKIYVVQQGDTLYGIARQECGDPGAVVSILEANLGRLQPDGGALIEPDRIRPGWQLVLDCSASGSLSTFTEAASSPTVPPDPGGTPERQAVPEHTIKLRASDDPAGEECRGSTVLPSIRPWVIRAGAAAATVELSQGSSLLFVTQDFGGEVTVSLVDAEGRRTPIDGASANHYLYVDPNLPPGDYVIEATAGDQVGTGAIAVTRASRLDLERRSPLDYDIVGGGESIEFAIYRWAPGACDEDAQAWQESAALDLAEGVGRVRISTDGAPAGTYCLAIKNAEADPVDQCRWAERRFLVG